MQALVNAFLRCLSLLLPPPWLGFSLCFWAANGREETQWPNPRARLKSRKPLTYEEVTRGASSIPASTTLPPARVSPAASSPSAPQGSPRGHIGGLWQAVERVVGAPFAFHRRWGRTRRDFCAPFPVAAFEPSERNRFQGSAVIAETATGTADGSFTLSGTMSVATEFPHHHPTPTDRVSDSVVVGHGGIDEVITVDQQHLQEMGTVTITVAIQAADDEEPEELSSNHLEFLGGSCSDDDLGRHDKSRLAGNLVLA